LENLVKAGFWLGARGFGTGDVELTDEGINVKLPAGLLKFAVFGMLSHFMRGKEILLPYTSIVAVGISKHGLMRTKCVDITFLDKEGKGRKLIFAPYVGRLKPKYISEEWVETIKERVSAAKSAPPPAVQMPVQPTAPPAPEPQVVVNFCPNCGKRVSPGDKFCKACGTPLR